MECVRGELNHASSVLITFTHFACIFQDNVQAENMPTLLGGFVDSMKNELMRVASKLVVSLIIIILQKSAEHLYGMIKAVFGSGGTSDVLEIVDSMETMDVLEIVEVRRSARKREPPQYYGFEEDIDSEQEESDDESSDDESDGNTLPPPYFIHSLIPISHNHMP